MPTDNNYEGEGIRRLNEIRHAVERATNESDPGYLRKYATEDVVAMPASGSPKVGIDECAASVEGYFGAYDIDIEYNSDEVVIGELFAFDRGIASEHVEAKEGDETYEEKMEYFWLYRRTANGDWKQFRLVWKHVEW